MTAPVRPGGTEKDNEVMVGEVPAFARLVPAVTENTFLDVILAPPLIEIVSVILGPL
jgi:hypothetical protein